MNILITGGNGYIGKCLYRALKTKYNITTVTRNDFDLCDFIATKKWFTEKYFDIILHTAAIGGSRLQKDDSNVLDQNLVMYYNLVSNSHCYNKFINFSSGAEIFARETTYGLSKAVITKSIKDKLSFFNIRIFAVFNEDELDTRFIKSNIKRYINKQPMIVHQNKKMDFFYMNDFLSLVEYYINSATPPKTIDCTYSNTPTLLDVANIINNLDQYRVEIHEMSLVNNLERYCGTYTPLINYKGIEYGIKETYKNILNL